VLFLFIRTIVLMSSPKMETEFAEEVQDGRRVRGDRTKRTILAKAVDVASVEGLEGLSIGRLAAELGVSKSGLFAHFGSGRRAGARDCPADGADGLLAALPA
jgi:AcrR family transcriptional regulator